MTLTTSMSSNLVAVEPGAIREDTPPGSVIQYSDYELDTSSPYAGGVAWIEGEYLPAEDARISIFDTGFGHSDLTYTVAHVWHGNIFRLGDHLDRLLDGARKLRLDAGHTKEELADITKRCVSMSQLRESFVNLTVTRGYGKKKGEKDLSKLTHQVYIYAIPYLWAFPPAEQIFGTTAIVPRHVRRAGRNTVDPTVKNYQWGDLTAASFEAKDRGARAAVLGFEACGRQVAPLVVLDGRVDGVAAGAADVARDDRGGPEDLLGGRERPQIRDGVDVHLVGELGQVLLALALSVSPGDREVDEGFA